MYDGRRYCWACCRAAAAERSLKRTEERKTGGGYAISCQVQAALEAFAGVDRPKAILSAFVAKPYTSAWLLRGASGLGKTTMAFAAATALGASQTLGCGVDHVPARKCDLETIDRIIMLNG
jgi:hypothetical protein